jgi:membrane protein YqaA with SNARE-associated domain
LQILIGLFVAAFVSATLLPGSSEVVLAGILASGQASVGAAVLVATIGNTLGACVNWAIGRYFAHFRHHRHFPVDADKFDAYAIWYQKWGVWSLLASWVPIIGDPLTVLAGVARTPFLLFVAMVFFAKAVRYLVVAGVISLFW